jgi:periplasmic protein TonB
MVATSVPYGAMELKLVAQRFWITGFLISLAIHAAILGAFHIRWFDTTTDVRHIPFHEITIGSRPIFDPLIPGIVTPPATGGNHVRSERANPVPVPEDKVDPGKDMATQTDMALAVDPEANGVGSGAGTDPGTITVDPADEKPVPFEAVEKLPEIVTRVAPVYPDLAVRAGIEGKVVVRMLVGKDGHVRDASVAYSTADCLNDAALEAARRFLFTPAYMNNGPVPVWITVPFSFRLK